MGESTLGGLPPDRTEAGPKRKAYLVYRDNDLYQTLHASMVLGLQGAGFEVSEQVFPKETSEEKIEQWVTGHKADLYGHEFITDTTFRRSIANSEFDLISELNSHGSKFNILLDQLIDEVSCKSIFGNSIFLEIREARESQEKAQFFIQQIVRKICANQEMIPGRVVILPKKMMDHFPRSSEKQVLPSYDEEIDAFFANLVKSWLQGAGLDPTTITVTDPEESLFLSASEVGKVDSDKTWFILDRHLDRPRFGFMKDLDKPGYFYLSGDQKIKIKGKILFLPTSNFIESCISEKLIEGDLEVVKKNVQEALSKI